MNGEEKVLKILEKMQTDITNMQTDITNMRTDISDIKIQQKEHSEMLLSLRTDVQGVKDQLDDMDSKNANNHIIIKTNLDQVIENQKSLHEMYGEHEVEIRNLKRRPV